MTPIELPCAVWSIRRACCPSGGDTREEVEIASLASTKTYGWEGFVGDALLIGASGYALRERLTLRIFDSPAEGRVEITLEEVLRRGDPEKTYEKVTLRNPTTRITLHHQGTLALPLGSKLFFEIRKETV